jgi:hypothetical protein
MLAPQPAAGARRLFSQPMKTGSSEMAMMPGSPPTGSS